MPDLQSARACWLRSVLAPAAVAVLIGAGPVAADSPDVQPDELLVGFHGGVSDLDADEAGRSAGGRKLGKLRGLNVHRVAVSSASLEATEEALSRDPRVKFVERNRRVSPDYVVNDPSFSTQWHLTKIAAPTAWNTSPGASGIVVAVVDSGVDGTHPDLSPRMVPGYNFYSNNTNTADATGHGTAVAGTVAAAGNNGIGVSGVAWQAKIMPVRVADSSGVAYLSAIAKGIMWAADHGARVINTSFSGMAGSPTITNAAQYARTKGAVVVASAGNCGCVDGTAENAYVVSVSATDQNDAATSFTSRGNYIDVSAPGVKIATTQRGGGYTNGQGTSFAAPIVSGVVALMMKANGALLPPDIVKLVKANADDRGGTGWDASYGYGRVNANRAVVAAVASVQPPADTVHPVVTVTSPTAGTTVSGTATVSVSASDSGAVSRVDLYVDGAFKGSDTTASYSFAWDTRTVANGTHSLVAKAVDAAGNVGTSPAVTVTVSNSLADSTLPVTSISSMTISGGVVNVAASATDNVAVTRVDMYIDGLVMARRTSPPYTFSVGLTSVPAGNHSVHVRAYDAAGNVAVSSKKGFTK